MDYRCRFAAKPPFFLDAKTQVKVPGCSNQVKHSHVETNY